MAIPSRTTTPSRAAHSVAYIPDVADSNLASPSLTVCDVLCGCGHHAKGRSESFVGNHWCAVLRSIRQVRWIQTRLARIRMKPDRCHQGGEVHRIKSYCTGAGSDLQPVPHSKNGSERLVTLLTAE